MTSTDSQRVVIQEKHDSSEQEPLVVAREYKGPVDIIKKTVVKSVMLRSARRTTPQSVRSANITPTRSEVQNIDILKS